MRCGLQIVLLGALGVLIAGAVWAADLEIDKLLQSPVGKDWVTNGGNMTNQRYSTLKQIDTTNVKQLKGAWMTRLKGSGFGGKYSFEATPLVKDGIMYITSPPATTMCSPSTPNQASSCGSAGRGSTRS
jgi:quinohemoprotein ethanol dehydrogenase